MKLILNKLFMVKSKMSHAKNIVISFQFKGDFCQTDLLDHLLKVFAPWNFTKTEIHYTIDESSSKSLKFKSRGGVVNAKTLNNFRNNVKQCDRKLFKIDGFWLVSNTPDWKYRSIDTEFETDYTIDDGYNNGINRLNFTFDVEKNKDFNPKLFIANDILPFLLSKNCELLYGFVFACEKRKMPLANLVGIHTEFLDKYEDNKVQIWSDNLQNCGTKIWDVFWGNIISKGHLEKVETNYIERKCGKENVKMLAPDLLWFNLPEDLTNFQFSKFSWKRRMLYQYFKKLGMVMDS